MAIGVLSASQPVSISMFRFIPNVAYQGYGHPIA